MIELLRPLVIFDLETTSKDTATARIVQATFSKMKPDFDVETKTRLINPGFPIPADTTAVHGITNEMVADQPTFKKLANGLHQFLADCDLCGHNIEKFDVPILAEEFARCGIEFPTADTRIVDTLRIFTMKEPRTLAAALKFYCGIDELENAHSSDADVAATIKVFAGQLERYSDLPDNVFELSEMLGQSERVDFAGVLAKNKNGEIIYNIGKAKGKPVLSDVGFGEWILKGNFPMRTKSILFNLLYPNKQ